MSGNSTTFAGNLTRDPELRYTQSGKAVVSLGVASNRRFQVNGEWQEETTFAEVVAWGDLAENVAASLTKGQRVVVEGHLRSRTYETDGGEKRSKLEITADDIGASLRWAKVDIAKATRTGADQTGPTEGSDEPVNQEPNHQ